MALRLFPPAEALVLCHVQGPQQDETAAHQGYPRGALSILGTAPFLCRFGVARETHAERDLRCARVARSAWQEMQCHSSMLQLADFLLCETDVLSLQVPASEAKVAKMESNYERHHEELFLSAEWEWPLSEARFVRDIGPSMLCFSQRAREVVYVAHMKWEMPENVEAGCFEVLSALRSEA